MCTCVACCLHVRSNELTQKLVDLFTSGVRMHEKGEALFNRSMFNGKALKVRAFSTSMSDIIANQNGFCGERIPVSRNSLL